MLPFDSLADKAKCDSVVLPDSLQAQLAGRGPAIRRVLSAARSSFLNGKGGDPSSALHVVGTDCSGLDTPIMALQSLQFKFRHLFSSEIARGPQLWISANFRPEQFYKNMLHRKPMDGFSGYMAGFPCQPWSVLNHTSKFFKDPRAKVIVAMIDTVMSGLPQWAIFENVLGLLRFLKIFVYLKATGCGTAILRLHHSTLPKGSPSGACSTASLVLPVGTTRCRHL